MKVYIPTYKRMDRQPTAEALVKAGVGVCLVVRPEEAPAASEWVVRLGKMAKNNATVTTFILPEGMKGIHTTRQAVMDGTSGEDKIIMMDDDLSFSCRGRREDNPLYLSPMNPEDLYDAVTWLYDSLGQYAMVGLGAREGNNRKPTDTDRCSRMMRAWGIHRPTFINEGIVFDRVNGIEDFDVILQFLRKGYPNLISNRYVTNQPSSNSSGGCSTFRTIEYQAEQARLLQSLHPNYVKLVEKETKTAWGGGVRLDVNIQWKKAFANG